MEKPGSISFTVPDDAAAERLDRALIAALPDYSRSRIQALIAAGHVTLNSTPITDSNAKARAGQHYTIVIPEAVPTHIRAVELPLTILFEDEHMLIINKQAGMTVHPAPGHGDDTLVNALLAHCGDSLSGIGGVARPGIVHRIDKDTSGLLVVAKHDAAHQALSAQLADRTLKRVYRAVAWGAPRPAQGSIEGNIGRSPKNRKKMAVLKHGGKAALTHYATLESFAGGVASYLECTLDTGRTHQIRVHLTHKGHALIGDQAYGSTPPKTRVPDETIRQFPRQALHAYRLFMQHPVSGKPIDFIAEIPPDLEDLILRLRALK